MEPTPQIPPELLKELITEQLLKNIDSIPMYSNLSINRDKATVLLTAYKDFTEEQKNAVFDLICNIVGYIIYKQDSFLDAHLYGQIPDMKFRNRKESRDFALGYLQTGKLIDVIDGRIHILSEKELRAFIGLSLIHFGVMKWFDQRAKDPLQTQRFLQLEERGLGFGLIEVDGDKETELHRIQSTGAMRLFFDQCWNSSGLKIPFDRFHKIMKLSKHQKFRPSEYLKTLHLYEGDRLNRYAFVNMEDRYVYFQRTYATEPLLKSVLNEYQNQD